MAKKTRTNKEAVVDLVAGLGKRKQAPHFAQFAEDVINTWGGSQRFAEELKSIYDNTQNIQMRTSILRSIVRMVERNTAMGGSEDDLIAMSEEDLEAQALVLLRKMQDGRQHNRISKPSHRARGITAAQDPSRAGRPQEGSPAAVRTAAQPEVVPHEPIP